MAHCTSCGAALAGGEKFCGNCGAACPVRQIPPTQPNPMPPRMAAPVPPRPVTPINFQSQKVRNDAINKVVLIVIFGVLGLAVVGIGILSIAMKGRTGSSSSTSNSSSGQDSSGWAGNYGCVSQGKSYTLQLNGNGSVTLEGLHDAIWFESQEIGESPKADITIVSKETLFNLHKSGSQRLTGHRVDISCSRQ